MNIIPLAPLHSMGGYQDKPYLAPPSILLTRGLDPFVSAGILTPSHLTEEFGNTSESIMTGRIISIIHVNGVDAFVITSTGIYYIDMNTGQYVLRHTVSGSNNAILFDGYIYISNSTHLMRMDISGITLDTTWANFTLINTFHPMVIQNGILYIGNKYWVAIVDEAGTFVKDALDIDTDYFITALYDYGNELYIGAENSTPKSDIKLYRWNTWSESFSMDSTLNEDFMFGFCVVDGRMYLFTGSEESTKIFSYGEPHPVLYSTTPLKNCIIRYGTDNLYESNGKVYIATTFKTEGVNSNGGVWCFGSVVAGANPILVHLHSAPGLGVDGANVLVTCISPSKDQMYYGYTEYPSGNSKIARVSKTLRSSTFSLETSVLDLVHGDLKVSGVRVHCTELGNASNMIVRTYTNKTQSTVVQMLLNIPNNMMETQGSLIESATHKLVILGDIPANEIRAIDILLN